ncbi:MAG: hypothetical protein II540_02375, partial [Paludibacteraceae bacterium]|nr:hypothetical protein [Paludibacteraceae bacterium]
IQCMTLAGYTLQVKLEGQAVVSIAQTALGWAEVTYDVPAPVHVVIYLHAQSAASAPARIATRVEDAVSAGAYIQAVKIVPENAPVGFENVQSNDVQSTKFIRGGQLIIILDGKMYNATGVEVK